MATWESLIIVLFMVLSPSVATYSLLWKEAATVTTLIMFDVIEGFYSDNS